MDHEKERFLNLFLAYTTILQYNITDMSTDAPTLEHLAPARPVGYALIPHPNRKFQVIRHPEGGPLPHRLTPALVRSMRSKYAKIS